MDLENMKCLYTIKCENIHTQIQYVRKGHLHKRYLCVNGRIIRVCDFTVLTFET